MMKTTRKLILMIDLHICTVEHALNLNFPAIFQVSRCLILSLPPFTLTFSVLYERLTACRKPLTWNMLPWRSKRFPLQAKPDSEGSSDLLLHPQATFPHVTEHTFLQTKASSVTETKKNENKTSKQSFKVLSSFQSETNFFLEERDFTTSLRLLSHQSWILE